MITDQETNHVYFSSRITEDKRYVPFWNRLKPMLEEHAIPFSFIEGTRDIWCRDYMPLQKEKDRFVQFIYFPDYLLFPEQIRSLTHTDEITTKYAGKVKKSKLILDGGNVIRWKHKAIVTEKVFTDNKNREKKTVENWLKQDLEVDELFFIPKMPFEYTGHADGLVRFIDEGTLLVSDYSEQSDTWKKNFERALDKTGLKIKILPSFIDKNKNKDGEYTARGCYINYAQIGNKILFPKFGDAKKDQEAVEAIEKIYPSPDFKVIQIEANEIANEGGVLNCITWNILKS